MNERLMSASGAPCSLATPLHSSPLLPPVRDHDRTLTRPPNVVALHAFAKALRHQQYCGDGTSRYERSEQLDTPLATSIDDNARSKDGFQLFQRTTVFDGRPQALMMRQVAIGRHNPFDCYTTNGDWESDVPGLIDECKSSFIV